MEEQPIRCCQCLSSHKANDVLTSGSPTVRLTERRRPNLIPLARVMLRYHYSSDL